ncbi:hypothetical protein O6H91_14G076000 [Diphasiastrum complanatum]|uniref:Uncharacterized protein n=1 Tax=Diphasiastrum complanatum TaxID=34168 RepID=A0ACC2BQZ8_DIPCM|nr:hypothetical protein O6H91_14G076000 [Diphasiastrum complanatum]
MLHQQASGHKQTGGHENEAQALIKSIHTKPATKYEAGSPGYLIYRRDELILNHQDLFVALWMEGFQPRERIEKDWVVYTLGGKLNPPVEVSLPLDISTTVPNKMQAFLRRAGKNFMCKWEMMADNWTELGPVSTTTSLSRDAAFQAEAGSSPERGYTPATPSQVGGQNSKSILLLHEHMQHKLAEQQRREKESNPSVNKSKSKINEQLKKLAHAGYRRQQKHTTV